MGKPSNSDPMRAATRLCAETCGNRARLCAELGAILFAMGLPIVLATAARAQTQATTLPLMLPSATAFDAAGNLYFAETGNHVVRKVTPAGIITTVAGSGVQGFSGDNGPATAAELDSPAGLALDSAGDLYIADSHNHRVREVAAATGTISTIAGTGAPGFSGDGGPATAAQSRSAHRARTRRIGKLVSGGHREPPRAPDRGCHGRNRNCRGQRHRGLRRRQRPSERGLHRFAQRTCIGRRRQPLHRRHAQRPRAHGERGERPDLHRRRRGSCRRQCAVLRRRQRPSDLGKPRSATRPDDGLRGQSIFCRQRQPPHPAHLAHRRHHHRRRAGNRDFRRGQRARGLGQP